MSTGREAGGSASAKLNIFRCWQAAGKPVVVTCPKEEVPELVRQLDPRGLLLCPCGVRTPDEAQSLFDLVDG